MKLTTHNKIVAATDMDTVEEAMYEIYNDLMSQIDSMLDNYALTAQSDFPEYNAEWCDVEGDSKESRKLEQIQDRFVHAVLDVLFKYVD